MARLRAVRLAAELTIAAAAAAVGWAGPERYGVVEQVAGADRGLQLQAVDVQAPAHGLFGGLFGGAGYALVGGVLCAFGGAVFAPHGAALGAPCVVAVQEVRHPFG